MKYLFFAALFFYAFCAATQAQDTRRMEEVRKTFGESPTLKNAQYSLYAKYIGVGDIIDINSAYRLSPASVLKLYTAAAALDILGPDAVFTTKVYYGGALRGGKLNGDIYIRGAGDPTLGSRRFPGVAGLEELIDGWVSSVKNSGINKITGNIYADNGLFAGVLLPWRTSYQNIGNYFAAPADALSARDNSFDIFFEPAPTDGQAVKVETITPKIKGLDVISYVKASASTDGDAAYVSFVPGSHRAEIYGVIPISDAGFKIAAAMPSPARFLADYFKAKLEAAGVKVSGAAFVIRDVSYDDKFLLIEHNSPPASQIVKYMNKRSFNLYADTLIRLISAYGGGPGDARDGVNKVKDFLARLGVDAGDFSVYDGSGLARDNITTCKITVNMLEKMLERTYKDVFLDSLAVAGDPEESGTLSRRLRGTGAAHNALVKTGTMERVRAHAGYTKDSFGKDIAFCVVSNNYAGKVSDVDMLHEGFIEALSDIGLNHRPGRRKP